MYSAIPVPGANAEDDRAGASAALEEAFERHRDMLASEGLLAGSNAGGASVEDFKQIERPEIGIFHPGDARAFGLCGEEGAAVRVSFWDVAKFLAACWRASWLLRRRHISQVVGVVRARKQQLNAGIAAEADYRSAVAIFRRLRPWYPRTYLCLWEALALVEYLAGRGLFPDWVFAVQAQPFGAHCWLQAGGVILNENTEYAGRFTPIMSV